MATEKTSDSNNQLQRIKLDDSQITVQLKPPKSPRKKKIKLSRNLIIFLTLCLVLGSTYAIVLMNYIFPKSMGTFQNSSTDIGVSYKSPQYLSIGDKNVIEVLIINLSAKESYTGIVTLKFHNPAVSITTTSDQGASISIKDLPPGGRITRSIEIKLTKKPNEEAIYYYLEYSPREEPVLLYGHDKNRVRYRTSYDKFLIAPIGYLRSSLSQVASIIGGTGLLSLAGNYLWSRIKKSIGWE